MVICGKPAVTWFVASTNQCHSVFLILHFTFRIPHSAILHFTHNRADRTLCPLGRIAPLANFVLSPIYTVYVLHIFYARIYGYRYGFISVINGL